MSKFEIIYDQIAELDQREKSLAMKIQVMQAQLDEVRNFRLDLIGAVERQQTFDEKQAEKQASKDGVKT